MDLPSISMRQRPFLILSSFLSIFPLEGLFGKIPFVFYHRRGALSSGENPLKRPLGEKKIIRAKRGINGKDRKKRSL